MENKILWISPDEFVDRFGDLEVIKTDRGFEFQQDQDGVLYSFLISFDQAIELAEILLAKDES